MDNTQLDAIIGLGVLGGGVYLLVTGMVVVGLVVGLVGFVILGQ